MPALFSVCIFFIASGWFLFYGMAIAGNVVSMSVTLSGDYLFSGPILECYILWKWANLMESESGRGWSVGGGLEQGPMCMGGLCPHAYVESG